jgi:hypothetical protein
MRRTCADSGPQRERFLKEGLALLQKCHGRGIVNDGRRRLHLAVVLFHECNLESTFRESS